MANLYLTDADLACIEEHARANHLDFPEAVNAVLAKGLSLLPAKDGHQNEDTPLRIVDLRGTPAAERPDVALAAAGAVESVDEEATPPPPTEENPPGQDQAQPQPEGGK